MMVQNVRHYRFTIIWSFIILVLCLMPKSTHSSSFWLFTIPYFDKMVHISLYVVMGIIMFYERKTSIRRIIVLCVLYSFLLGGIIELIQPYVGRTAEFFDLLSDVFGAVLGLFVGYRIHNT